MKKYLFIDRDGTIVCEPHDYQVDALDKVVFFPRVIPALLKLADMGYTMVMVSNQNGLGTDAFPLNTFAPAHEHIVNTLESQGISFEQILICPHMPEDNCQCRKPALGLVQSYMSSDEWDRNNSYFIGDRDTDLAMAKNMGIVGIRVGLGDAAQDSEISSADSPFAQVKAMSWDEIVAFIAAREKEVAARGATACCGAPTACCACASAAAAHAAQEATEKSSHHSCSHDDRPARTARIERNTRETQILVELDLDHCGETSIDTGIGFFDHMLDQIATHAGFNLKLTAKGDLHIDSHHTIEDTAITLGTALRQALGDKRGIGRFGFIVPMDELTATVCGFQDCDTCSSQCPAASGNRHPRTSPGPDDRSLRTLGCSCQMAEAAAECQADREVSVALDISGRPHIEFSCDAEFTREQINGFETQMVSHFFESLAVAMGLTLHMKVTPGNAHHQVEALFKAFGRALRPAIRVVSSELPSSKGTL